jgi:hypothetical protein
MRMTSAALVIAAGAALLAIGITSASAGEAASGCRVRGFLVNDFGKDEPARDAEKLLDKDIATWAKANGIGSYKVGPKKTTCELYIDVGLFHEYTCTAKARVCW